MTVEEFKKNINNWLTSSGFPTLKIDLNKINEILNIDPDEYQNMRHEDILTHVILLKRYMYELESIIDENNTMMLFAETIITHINSDYLVSFDEYVKWDLKLVSASKRDNLSESLLKVYNNAKSRLNISKSKIENIKSIIKTLEDICNVKRNRNG